MKTHSYHPDHRGKKKKKKALITFMNKREKFFTAHATFKTSA